MTQGPLPPRTFAILLAAGQGLRAGGAAPKQYRPIGGIPMVRRAARALADHPAIAGVVLVVGIGQEQQARAALADCQPIAIITGGATRRESVRAGIDYLAALPGVDNVLIHDAARPFLPAEVTDRLLAALGDSSGAIPVRPIVDTLVRGTQGAMGETVDRQALYRVQTPQAFRFPAIAAAHRAWNDAGEPTDDAQVLRAHGGSVTLVEGSVLLEKITLPDDFAAAEQRIARETRVGMGYDVHRLVAGESLWLCGVELAHDKGLSGHSDADVALHALVDALLGALGDGDIGSHFPPSDPQWRGVASSRFVDHACALVRARGGAIVHVDVTLICESPKIGPHREAMRARLAVLLDIPVGRVSVKATTTERLGFAGRGEGIAAQAVATLSLPQEY